MACLEKENSPINLTSAAENVQDIELIDIEDIVPVGGNSLFLSCARAIIYMSHKNPKFANALNLCCSINLSDYKTDMQLQKRLRQSLCEYFCTNGIVFDKSTNKFQLREEYSKYFNGNIYDFLIQVYQLSINNFSNNALYKKYTLITISQLLNMKICYKRVNGQWKMYEPFANRYNGKNFKKGANQQYLDEVKYESINKNKSNLDYLNEHIIYLQELRTDTSQYLSSSNNKQTKKLVRILLSKKLWVSKFADNPRICMKFSQFNDESELNSYQKLYFTIEPKLITDSLFFKGEHSIFKQKREAEFDEKLFCVFIHNCSVHLILNSDYTSSTNVTVLLKNTESLSQTLDSLELSQEYNTIGKQLTRFAVKGPNKLYQYLNYLWGRQVFDEDFVSYKFSLLSCDKQ